MFDQTHKTAALTFARALAAKDYAKAYAMLSAGAQSRMTLDQFREAVDRMLPPEFGDVDLIEIQEVPEVADMFVYVVLGGDVYSEAIMVEAFAAEGGTQKIERFTLGRP